MDACLAFGQCPRPFQSLHALLQAYHAPEQHQKQLILAPSIDCLDQAAIFICRADFHEGILSFPEVCSQQILAMFCTQKDVEQNMDMKSGIMYN